MSITPVNRDTEVIKVIKVCQVCQVYLDSLVVLEFLEHLVTEDLRWVISVHSSR